MLSRYKEFLRLHSSNYAANEIDDDLVVGSSLFMENAADDKVAELINQFKVVKEQKYISKEDVDIENLRAQFRNKKDEEKEEQESIKHTKDEQKYLSTTIDYDDYDDDLIIHSF